MRLVEPSNPSAPVTACRGHHARVNEGERDSQPVSGRADVGQRARCIQEEYDLHRTLSLHAYAFELQKPQVAGHDSKLRDQTPRDDGRRDPQDFGAPAPRDGDRLEVSSDRARGRCGKGCILRHQLGRDKTLPRAAATFARCAADVRKAKIVRAKYCTLSFALLPYDGKSALYPTNGGWTGNHSDRLLVEAILGTTLNQRDCVVGARFAPKGSLLPGRSTPLRLRPRTRTRTRTARIALADEQASSASASPAPASQRRAPRVLITHTSDPEHRHARTIVQHAGEIHRGGTA